MSDDLEERLRLHRSWRDSHGELNDAPNEAAAELTRLREQLAEAREALAKDRAEWVEIPRVKLGKQEDG